MTRKKGGGKHRGEVENDNASKERGTL